MSVISNYLSPRRLGFHHADEGVTKQKNQDWPMLHCNAAPTARNPVMA